MAGPYEVSYFTIFVTLWYAQIVNSPSTVRATFRPARTRSRAQTMFAPAFVHTRNTQHAHTRTLDLAATFTHAHSQHTHAHAHGPSTLHSRSIFLTHSCVCITLTTLYSHFVFVEFHVCWIVTIGIITVTHDFFSAMFFGSNVLTNEITGMNTFV